MNTTRFQTRGVLGGAYKAGTAAAARAMLTHLVDLTIDGGETALCRRVKAGNMADEYAQSPEELTARPTCPLCAAKWDKLTK
jgi:hypothetical protein